MSSSATESLDLVHAGERQSWDESACSVATE